MRIRKFHGIFVVLGLFVILASAPRSLQAACEYQVDAPDCGCFTSTGDWDAGGTYTQDTALTTLGTVESCRQPEPHYADDDSGKPYYQMILGMNTVAGALTASYVLSVVSDPPFAGRQEWCSETVSYWHRQTGIPYTLGFRNDWHEGWQIYGVPDLRTWFETEEATGGRGRWIQSNEVDYSGTLGETIPTPGAYMARACYHPYPSGHWCDPAQIDLFHSMLVDEVTLHTDAHGDIFQVEVTILQGNSGRQVTTGRLDDVFSVTVRGSQWLSYSNGTDGIVGTADDYGKKLYGFGIPLDQYGAPIYDASRLHVENHPEIRRVRAAIRTPEDQPWNTFYLSIKDKLNAFAQALKGNGPSISCTPPSVDIQKTPDGKTESWVFPDSISQELVIELDYLNPYPRGVEGIVLSWDPGFIPLGYQVHISKDKQNYEAATVPDMSGFQPLQGNDSPIPVKTYFANPVEDVRYLRLTFPAGTFSQQATLNELVMEYETGLSEDSPDGSDALSTFVDIKPGSCPNLLNTSASGTVVVAILGTDSLDVTQIETGTILLNGVSLTPDSIDFQDQGTPFIGSDPWCHTLGADGDTDLILTYGADDFVNGLGLDTRRGETIPVVVTGTLKATQDSEPFVGQDFARLNTLIPHMLLLENN